MRFRMRIRVRHTFCRRLLPLVALVVPGETGTDLVEIDVAVIKKDGADDPTVPVVLGPVDDDGFAMDGRAQMPLRDPSKRLMQFRRIDTGEAYLVQDLPGIHRG